MNKQQLFLAGLYVAAAVLLTGCIVAAVGAGAAGTVAYVKGDLETIEAKKLQKGHQGNGKSPQNT